MVDFRYHLISLIAVFLALGLGILMGTVVLNDALVESLERDIRQVREHNQELEEEIDDQDRRIDAANAFANEAAPWLTGGTLTGRVIVIVQLEGTDGDMAGSLRDGIEDAGGEVPTTLVLTERFALGDPIERDQLALVIDSAAGTAVDLRFDAGTSLGARLAAAAAEAPTPARPQDVATERLGELLQGLQDADFVSVDAPEGQSIVPSNAMFLVLGGNASEETYNATGLVAAMVAELSSRGAPTLVAEPAGSTWDLVTAVREDPEAATRVATADQADTVEGRIAVVL
ncbi:MAG: copper transporter, partial [Actinomycetota bacterium]|nr:copper transporter [Actinomycetota bacterium]